MSRFLVNNFCTYCLNFEGNPSNLHLCIFQKAEIAQAALASVISAFWKTHKCKLIIISNWTRKTVWLLINNTKTKKFCAQKSSGRCFLKPFLAFKKTFFRVSVQNFCHCFTWMRPLAYKISHCLSANNNPELLLCNLHWCYT